MRTRFLQPYPACLLSIVLVGMTTWGLLRLQEWVTRLEGGHVHPYGIGFVIPIALLTVLGGRGPGFFTLALSLLSSIYILTFPHFSWRIHHASDWAELGFLLTAGTLLVMGMEALRRNLELFRETREAQARLQAVMDTSPVGIVTCDLDGTLRYANRAAERIWGHPLISVGQDEWRRYRLLEPDGTPTPPGRTTLARVLSGEASRLSREMIVEQPGGARVWVDSTSALVRDESGRPLGGLIVLSDITQRKRAEQEVADLLAQAQARAEREALLNRIGQVLRSAQEPETIQARVTAALGPALGADRCYFNFIEPERHWVRVGPDWRRPDLLPLAGEYRMADLGGTWEALYPGGATLIVRDTHEMQLPDALAASFGRMGIRSVLSVPLIGESGFVGALAVAMADAVRDWTADEVALVETVATQTRTAIESARVRRREQTIAATLQDALRPRLPEPVPGLDLKDFYQPALEEANVGGDFYDVFPLDKGLFALAVGDVSGKGLAAAAQVATVRNMLRYALYQRPRLAAAVTELNRIISTQELLVGFATLFVGIYDTATQEFTYASCGHEPGLVRRPGGEVVEMPPTGPVLGAAAQVLFDQESLALRPGDAIVLYTDGISEAGRSQHDLWGVEGVKARLQAEPEGETAADLAAHVIAGAVAHAQGVLHDDVCLLAGIVQANGLNR